MKCNIKNKLLLRMRPAFLASFLKKILRVRRHVIQSNGCKFYIDPISNFGYRILSEKGYEPDMVYSLNKILDKGDTFLDIGGNEGFFSILASKLVCE